MQPKKKNSSDPIIFGITLVIALYFALQSATVKEIIDNMLITGAIREREQVITFLGLLVDRLSYDSFNIVITRYTKNFLIYTFILWLIVVVAIVQSRKNYINGKEFGTSKWGTVADIRDLFADVILKGEIREVMKLKTKLGRWIVKYNLDKKLTKDGQKRLSIENKKILDAFKNSQSSDKKADKRLKSEELQKARKKIKKEIDEAKINEWQPSKIDFELKQTIQNINESPLYKDGEKKDKIKEAKAESERQLVVFYDVNEKVKKLKDKYADADMLFTETERVSIYNFKLNNNTLIIGGSGSGKTRCFVMPNILQAHSSFVVTDPKGEILEKAGHFLQDIKGYKIRVLNLDDKSKSDGYNPFAYIHPERQGYEERVLSLIETIIINTDGGEKKGGSDPFWDKAERLFLQSIFFFTCDGFVEKERNMSTVLSLIGMLKLAEDKENFDSDLDYFVKIFTGKFGVDHIGVQQFKEFREKASGKTAKSIVISAVARLAPFRTKAVRKIFSKDSMNLERLGEEKTAIFIVVPPTDTTFNFIAGMLFTQMFQELQYCATQVHKHNGQRLPVPVRFILDEFANTCTIPNFVQILAYARSFGIGITPIIQSLEQIKNMYKDEWGAIVDNCNSLLFLGSVMHGDPLEYISKLLGKGTFDKKTTGVTKGGRSGSYTQNFDVIGRELLDAAEIRKLPISDCLLILGGRNPFYSKKYNYKEHKNYRFTSDANKSNSYDYVPVFASEVTHGEEVLKEKQKITDISISAQNAINNFSKDFITIENDIQKAVSRATKCISDGTGFISNEELLVDVGENILNDGEAILDILVSIESVQKGIEDEKLTSLLTRISENTKKALEEAEKDTITIELDIKSQCNRLGRVIRTGGFIQVISDIDLTVQDGEIEEINEELELFEVDDIDNDTSMMEFFNDFHFEESEAI